MRMKLAVLFLILLASAGFALEIGDKAPPLKAATWLNGSAVDPSKPDGKTTYVVEFWATWCPECRKVVALMNDLQARLKDRHVIIAAVTTEPETKVRPFVDKEKMNYLVALDTNETAAASYMAGVPGIPHAFIVDTNGVVVWTGHPLDRMARALDKVLAGTYRMDQVKQIKAKEAEVQNLLIAQDLPRALSKVDELIDLDKESFDYYQLKLGLMAQTGDLGKLKETYEAMYAVFTDSPDELNALAWIAATSPFRASNLDIAWKAAHRAAELTQRKNPAVLDTLARVYSVLGFLDRAVAAEAEAVKTSPEDKERAEYQLTLDYYTSAAALHEQISKTPEKKPTP